MKRFPDEALIFEDYEDGMLYEVLEFEKGHYDGIQVRTLLDMRTGMIPVGTRCEIIPQLLRPLTPTSTEALAIILASIK